MKKELFEYATHTLFYKDSKKGSIFYSDFYSGMLASVLLLVCSFFMFIKRPYVWIFLIGLWVWMLVRRRKERNRYERAILIDGMFLLYFAIFSSFVLVDRQIAESGDSCKLSLFLISIFSLALYEIVILIKIKQKKYSYKEQVVRSQQKGKTNNQLILILSTVGGFAGVAIAKATSKFIAFPIYQAVFTVGISVMFLCGCILLQKYLILKMLNKTGDEQSGDGSMIAPK